jgi:diguanylate cyclase (GGDEF)-like protein
VRYVGQPLGEVIEVPAAGLELGRSAACGLCLDEPGISRHHARLEPSADGGALRLVDLNSTNGVYVNGRRVPAAPHPVTLQAGDVVRAGSHAFKLKRLDARERRYHEAAEGCTALDPATGVGTRAAILRQLEGHVELARRHARPLSVLIVDLDHLGRLNETYGAEAGDRVLQDFGAQLRNRLRTSDPVGRLGGEEFLAVLPDTPAGKALNAAEDLRSFLAEHVVDLPEGQSLRATCSVGVAELRSGDPDGGALLARADAALYRAKAEGRNRVIQAP